MRGSSEEGEGLSSRERPLLPLPTASYWIANAWAPRPTGSCGLSMPSRWGRGELAAPQSRRTHPQALRLRHQPCGTPTAVRKPSLGDRLSHDRPFAPPPGRWRTRRPLPSRPSALNSTARRKNFRVTPATLIPRPETEHLIEAALKVRRPRSICGSGHGRLYRRDPVRGTPRLARPHGRCPTARWPWPVKRRAPTMSANGCNPSRRLHPASPAPGIAGSAGQQPAMSAKPEYEGALRRKS